MPKSKQSKHKAPSGDPYPSRKSGDNEAPSKLSLKLSPYSIVINVPKRLNAWFSARSARYGSVRDVARLVRIL